MPKIRKKEIIIKENKGVFSIIRKSATDPKATFRQISSLRSILTNEKSKILYFIQNNNPNSIYELSKQLKRNFKSVREDVMILKKFGLLELVKEKTKNRKRLKPKILVDELIIHIKFN